MDEVVLCTHMRGGSATPTAGEPRTCKAEFEILSQIAQRAGLKDYTVLILKQPIKYTSAQREQDRTAWEAAAHEIGPPLQLVYDDHYVPLEPTTLAWNKLYRYAFDHLDARCVVYSDMMLPLWEQRRRARAIDALGELVVQSLTADYVIGDYTPAVPLNARYPSRKRKDVALKIAIETRVKQMLSNRFPVLLDGWPLFEALKRPRSEFHALGRALYEMLRGLAPVPYDYGLQMLLVAKAKGLHVCRQEIGPVPEFGRYTLSKMAWQLRRVDFQLAQLQEWWAKTVTRDQRRQGVC